jgi:hypothetical protein
LFVFAITFKLFGKYKCSDGKQSLLKIKNLLIKFDEVEVIGVFEDAAEGFNFIQDNVIAPVSGKTNAIKYLKTQFYSSYEDWFGSWAGTLKLDIVAVLALMFLMAYFINKQLKNKVEVL